jgi:phage FluMu protein Com
MEYSGDWEYTRVCRCCNKLFKGTKHSFKCPKCKEKSLLERREEIMWRPKTRKPTGRVNRLYEDIITEKYIKLNKMKGGDKK